ncbi:MAG: ribosome biogenesis GTP-binding protein YihA/YsxC [Clostridia bacterium]|nr:ribosome biogenesis GTP-binding protein YihA/YsxC [Clostridia bacterium]
MQQFVIKQAEFVTSVGTNGNYPAVDGPEIAIVGKSNVGKSSLINKLTNNRKLAKTSSTPGKTRLINFFRLNNSFYLVDLPGYGFAKAPKSEQAQWGQLMESYLASGRVKHLFLLVDIRHEPTADDKQMFKYLIYYGIPFTLIATKADKLAKSKRKQEALKAAKALGAPKHAIAWSSETGDGMQELLERIGQIVNPVEAVAEEADAGAAPAENAVVSEE